MRKFINIIKLPLLCVCMAVVLTFSVLLITLSCQPHGKEYHLSQKTLGVIADRYFVFEDTVYTQITYKKGELDSSLIFEYKIEDGKLLSRSKPEDEFSQVGEINAYELKTKIKNIIFPVELTVILKCKENIAQKDLYIAMISSFGALAVISALLVLFVKKHPKQKLVSNQSTEQNLDNNQQPEQTLTQPVEQTTEQIAEQDTKQNTEQNTKAPAPKPKKKQTKTK